MGYDEIKTASAAAEAIIAKMPLECTSLPTLSLCTHNSTHTKNKFYTHYFSHIECVYLIENTSVNTPCEMQCDENERKKSFFILLVRHLDAT